MKKKLLSLATMLALVVLLMPSVKAEAASISNPKVVVEKVDFKDSIMTVTLTNMSHSVNVSDVLLTYESEKDVVVPVDGQANQAYIDAIAAGASATVEFPVAVKNAGSTSTRVDFNIEYVDSATDVQKSNKAFTVLDLTSVSGNLTISNVSFPREGYLYEKGLVSFTYKNATDSDISDLKLIVSGLNDGGVETYNVGDVKAKKTGYFETYLSFNTLGSRDVVVAYSYTTADGEDIVSEGTIYSTYVSERITEDTKPVVTDEPTDTDTNQKDFNMSYVFIGLAGLLVIICIIIAVTSARKNK